MEKSTRIKIAALVGIIIAIVIFGFNLASSWTFESRINMILIPKSEKAAWNLEQMTGNVIQLPQSLTFYNKLLDFHKDIEDKLAGKPDAERKALWNASFDIRRMGESSVVELSVRNANQFQAEVISRSVADDIIFVMGRYLDPKTDLEIRKTDGPIVTRGGGGNIASALIYAILAGLVFSLATYLIAGLFHIMSEGDGDFSLGTPDIFKRFSFMKDDLADTGTGDMIETPSFRLPEKKEPVELPKEIKAAPSQTKPEAKVSDRTKKSPAPGNLPVADASIMRMFGMGSSQPAEPTKEDKKEGDRNGFREATPEEVKARLNKLLQGR